MDSKNKIYVISDSLGETSIKVVQATVSQFDTEDYSVKTFNFVRTKQMVDKIIKEASNYNSLIIFTTVIEDVRKAIIEGAEANGVDYHDILTPMLLKFSNFFGFEPFRQPGCSYKLDDDYFERMAAIEFAVKYDDGKNLRGLDEADLVLIGISRTSKTPLSMYLSHKNIKVANIPLVPEIAVPREVFEIKKSKLIGLTNSPEILNKIRGERLKSMGLSDASDYASNDRIIEEIKFADDLYGRLGCPVINVANKAIEETASIILDITGLGSLKNK